MPTHFFTTISLKITVFIDFWDFWDFLRFLDQFSTFSHTKFSGKSSYTCFLEKYYVLSDIFVYFTHISLWNITISCKFTYFYHFWLFLVYVFTYTYSFSCRLKWATTTTCLGLSKAVFVVSSNKSHVRLPAWYYQYMSIDMKNRYFCIYFSTNIHDRIIHIQHILNMFRCVLRTFLCYIHVFIVVFIIKMSDIITKYRKTRFFRLFVYQF